MKIVVDARMYGTENGGIGRYIINLIDQLQKVDKKNKYVLLLRKKYFNQLNMSGNWEKMLVDAKHYSFKEQILVVARLRAVSPDLVHFPHFNVPVFYRGKYVVTIHDLLMHKRGAAATTLSPFSYAVKRVGYKLVVGNAIKNARKVIVPTNFVKDEVSKVYPKSVKKLKVIYEGVDKRIFGGGKLAKKPYFLYVGNVYPHKNVEKLIHAAALVKQNLVIVTPRNVFQKRLNEYVHAHRAQSYVEFVGHATDRELSTLYKNAAAFVYPSLEEGFGLPGLEAMASKCLVLASDIPVFREVYKDNAIYFDPQDLDSIKRAIKEALDIKNSEKEKLVNKAFVFAKKYSWEKNARETLEIYKSSLK